MLALPAPSSGPFTVQIEGDQEMMQFLENISTELGVGIEQVLDEAATTTADAMKSKVPYSTGSLMRSIEWAETGKYERTIGPSGEEEDSNGPLPAKYAKYVERGSSPHFPNPGSIAAKFGVSLAEGFLIARAISRKQYPGVWFSRETKDFAQTFFNRAVTELVANAIHANV